MQYLEHSDFACLIGRKSNLKVEISRISVTKRFSDLAQNLQKWSLSEITKSIFGVCDVTIFILRKFDFTVEISEIFDILVQNPDR